MTRLTKKELIISGIIDNNWKKTASDDEMLIVKNKAKDRLNRITLQGTLDILINEDNIILNEEVIESIIKSLFNTKVIEIDRLHERDRDYYSIQTESFSIIEIVVVNNKVAVNPFWE